MWPSMNPLFVLRLQSFPPSIVSCLLRLFYLGERGFGCDGGSTGEVVAVVAMVVAAAGKRGERVTCWTTFLCSCGGWCRVGGGGQSRIIIALQAIMNGLLFGGLLCPHLSATTSAWERNGGREKDQQRDKDRHLDSYLQHWWAREMKN